MRTYPFVTLDVFTDTRFGGNPLAVFPDASGLSDADMQALAREFNLSETTFVLPPADPANTARVRIFTPAYELPFAGHPNVGTGYVLARQGRDTDGSCASRRPPGWSR
jgi:trans-2,3-dihydro-3-hydroxyanthranilate isomerase